MLSLTSISLKRKKGLFKTDLSVITLKIKKKKLSLSVSAFKAINKSRKQLFLKKLASNTFIVIYQKIKEIKEKSLDVKCLEKPTSEPKKTLEA